MVAIGAPSSLAVETAVAAESNSGRFFFARIR